MASPNSSAAILSELTSTAETLLERHLSTTKEWFPHDLVPWSLGRDFGPDDVWDNPLDLPEAVVSALFVNLLTEDNLPYYWSDIQRLFGGDTVWGEWARRWVAEEGRHSIVIRDYLTVTRAIDPVMLERGRMQQVSHGYQNPAEGPLDGFVYVALQELATRISHRNTGKALPDKAGYEVMARVASDENLHYLFYRDMVTAALEVDPSGVVKAIERQVKDFEMPGTGISGFSSHAMAIARAGIYDFSIHHDMILAPVVLRHWRLEALEGLDAEAEEARRRTIRQIGRIKKAGDRFASRRDEQALASV